MKDILLYLPSKILPGALAIFTISILTRSLSVEEFGRYSYLLTLGSFLTVLLFSWLTLGVNRHYFNETNKIDNEIKETALSTHIFIFLVAFTFLVVFVQFTNVSYIYVLVLLIAWLNGLFDLLQQASILEGKKTIYSISVIIRPIFLFSMAVASYFLDDINATYLLLVIFLSYIFSCTFLFSKLWKNIRVFKLHNKEVLTLFRYGVPLTLNFGLMFIVSSSDKLLISYYLTKKDLGIYSASYDLFSQVMFGFGGVLSLALFPKSLKAYNSGSQEFQATTRKNIKVAALFLLAPICALSIFSSLVIEFGLSYEYHFFARQNAIIITVMTALYCLYSYTFIPILQLKKQIRKILFCSLLMALTNIILNVLFLERYGIVVGIYSTLASYCVGFLVCLFFTRDIWLVKVERGNLKYE